MGIQRQFFSAAVAAAAVTVAAVAASAAPAQAGQQVERPFRYVSEGTVSNEPLPCDSNFPNLECDQEFEGIDETATHMGRTTSTATGVLTLFFSRPLCTTPGGGLGLEYESTTERTIVAANGDALSFTTTVTGCSDGTNVTEPAGTYTVTGGTGRFAGASGEGEVSSVVLGGSINTVWTGTVTY